MSTSDNNQKEAVALVTGGARRVGRYIVNALSDHFRVAVHCHRPPDDTDTRIEDATYFESDLTAPAAPAKLIEDVIFAMGRLDVLVNNAAIFFQDKSPLLDLAKMKTLNVDAPRKLMAAARPHLKQRGGHIINIADIAGIRPFKKYHAYSKSKAALIEYSLSEALSLARDQIRINTICPGIVLPSEQQKTDALDFLQQQIPLNYIGKPEDVASLVAFLATSNFITGQVISVDGGRLLSPVPDEPR
ncbi:MAG: SDR family oxidoreductase [Deltaproteobacteria bacterium]|nr:SDR family oxidoreductase [Deltaproteobacteria bacterium]MBN2670615.1 SDR family oxidoreductase [Deltaproteobacteria bacterium]